MESKTQKMYRIKEVAMITDVNWRTVKSHINKGLLKASRVGKFWLISQENLDAYLNPKTDE